MYQKKLYARVASRVAEWLKALGNIKKLHYCVEKPQCPVFFPEIEILD